MGTFILDIAVYVWIIGSLAVLVGIFLQIDKSSLFTSATWISLGLVMDKVAPVLRAISERDPELGKNAWYMTWVFFYLLIMAVTWFWHNKRGWQLSLLSKYILLSCVAMNILQTSRMVDRLMFHTDYVAWLYKFGVPAINIAVVAAITLSSFHALNEWFKNKRKVA